MTGDEQAVDAVVRQLYAAIDGLISGQGLGQMAELWHQDDDVTSVHVSGDWAHGWDAVRVIWETFASIGVKEFGGLFVQSLVVRVRGDFAYTAAVLGHPMPGIDTMAGTDILERRQGQWKLVHHHIDRSPKVIEAISQSSN